MGDAGHWYNNANLCVMEEPARTKSVAELLRGVVEKLEADQFGKELGFSGDCCVCSGALVLVNCNDEVEVFGLGRREDDMLRVIGLFRLGEQKLINMSMNEDRLEE